MVGLACLKRRNVQHNSCLTMGNQGTFQMSPDPSTLTAPSKKDSTLSSSASPSTIVRLAQHKPRKKGAAPPSTVTHIQEIFPPSMISINACNTRLQGSEQPSRNAKAERGGLHSVTLPSLCVRPSRPMYGDHLHHLSPDPNDAQVLPNVVRGKPSVSLLS